MKLDQLAGNAALKRQLSAQADGRGLSHAYLISGPAGAGKATLAKLLAAAMVCTGQGEKPCGLCTACRKVRSGIHPDVIHVDIPEGKREILVEQVRQMRSDAWIRPNEGARKVYIIHSAQTMNPSAQNAILKLLEEGPAYAAFLLLSDNPGAMLSTIRSRCEGAALVPAEGTSSPEDSLARTAALELLDLLAKRDELALYAWAVPLEKWNRGELSQLFQIAVELLRQALAPTPAAPAQVLAAAALPKKKLLEAVSALEKLRSDAEFNVGAGHLAGAMTARLGGLLDHPS